MRARRRTLVVTLSFFLASVLLVGVAFGQVCEPLDVTPGRVNLEIRFDNTSGVVVDRIAAHPVAEASGEPVRLASLESTVSAARALYELGALPPSPVATATVLPDVPELGASYLILVEPVEFTDGARYWFGAPSENAVAAEVCGPVLPLSQDPDGVDCEISECAFLLEVHIQLTGDASDIGALDGSEPVVCWAEARAETAPGSGWFRRQATSSSYSYSVSDLTNTHGELFVLARADSLLRVGVMCTAPVAEGEEGFVLIPDTRLTPLSASLEFVPPCEPNSTTSRTENAVLPVERNGGVLKGLFDISGYTEVETWVDYQPTPFGWQWIEPPSVPADSLPDPENPWIFEGVLSSDLGGLVEVHAKARVDGDRMRITLPHKTGVEIIQGEETDLGATFVAMPQRAVGTVILVDPSESSAIGSLETGPIYGWANPGTSFATAFGSSQLPPGPNSGLAEGGRSDGILTGSYDAESGTAVYEYELLLAGLSPEDGRLDGRSALRTEWEVPNLMLRFREPDGARGSFETVSGVDTSRTLDPLPDAGEPAVIEMDTQVVCLGEIGLSMHTDGQLAQLYLPQLSGGAFGDYALSLPGDWRSRHRVSSVRAWGLPATIEERAAEATVSATVPAGHQYRLWPSVVITPPDGSASSYQSFNQVTLPLFAPLECGESTEVCLTVDENCEERVFGFSVTNSVPLCMLGSNLDFVIEFETGVLEVAFLRSQIDDGEILTHCEPCTLADGTTPAVMVSMIVPEDGEQHQLRFWAEDVTTCPASVTKTVTVVEPLSMVCAPDFTCVVPLYDIPLPPSHPCITAALTDPELTGGCFAEIGVVGSIPGSFPLGPTEVTWETVGGTVSCTTTVTVEAEPDRYLAFAEGDSVRIHQVGVDQPFVTIEVEGPTWIEFDDAGSRLAVATDVQTHSAEVFHVSSGFQLYSAAYHNPGLNAEFRPEDPSVLAVLARKPQQSAPYEVCLFTNGILLDRTALPLNWRMSEPEIAWSPDGQRLMAIFTTPRIDGDGFDLPGHVLHIYDWPISASGFGAEILERRLRPGSPEAAQELLYSEDDTSGVFATEARIARFVSANVQTMVEVENDAIDVIPDLTAAVFLLVEGDVFAHVAVLGDPGVGLGPDVDEGPELEMRVPFAPAVAMSSDGRLVAVALDEMVRIYEYPEFDLVESVRAIEPHHLRFRPAP